MPAERVRGREQCSVHPRRGDDGVHIVGSTSIDALLYSVGKIRSGEVASQDLLPSIIRNFIEGHKTVLVTAHRRENHGLGIQRICEALRRIVDENPDTRIVYPTHPNPNVSGPVRRLLGGQDRILLCEPLPYLAFVEAMDRASIMLTDSGGVQEEGPSSRKPILVMRETTERPEGVTAGFAKLVGTDVDLISHETSVALIKGCTTDATNPYGDGTASRKINRTIEMTFARELAETEHSSPDRSYAM